ncbi:uncharacterized protein [Drosophila suzukii]|uniref:Secreted protein n=1 Tax=Drosophila suzukii TaxID=28584 RepID=A0ABM4TX43_DROSZ|nr:uncharacterized protein LOC108018847 [Drosophila suzukii]
MPSILGSLDTTVGLLLHGLLLSSMTSRANILSTSSSTTIWFPGRHGIRSILEDISSFNKRDRVFFPDRPLQTVFFKRELASGSASVLKVHTPQTALRSPTDIRGGPDPAAPSSSKNHKASFSHAEGTTKRSPYPCLLPTSLSFGMFCKNDPHT